MKKIYITLLLLITFLVGARAQDAKTVSDCVVTYDVTVQDPQAMKSLAGATRTLYIKGSKSRTDFETPTLKLSSIFDAKNDTIVVLRESGNNKFISYVPKSKRREQNKRFEGIKFDETNDRKTILGYDCKKVVATLSDGAKFDLYYTQSIAPTNEEFEYQFKDLNGFVLEYEALMEDGKTKVKYSASKISLLPVPLAKFDIPKAGYRVL